LPLPPAEPPIATALPGGTVVGSQRTSSASVSILPVADPAPPPSPAPAAGAPIVGPAPTVNGKQAGGPVLMPEAPVVTPITTNAATACATGGCGLPGGDCCWPIGAHGPIGQEVYIRSGAAFPLGNALLVRGLNTGWATTVGGRAQFFDAPGDAAWVLDFHGFYTYNNSSSQDVATVRGEPVTVRALHRSGVGLGIGRDYFLAGPGFVGGIWDANFHYGWDAGARWGAGHADLNLITNHAIYRRHYDVFGQPFAGLNAALDIPMGGWTGFVGGRLEWNYTFSDIIPKGGSFQEIVAQLTFGVRY
jgi:hypothetical protein